MITIRYFASLKDRLNTNSEELEWNKTLSTVTAIKELLALRSGEWAHVLHSTNILSAVNQKMADGNAAINDNDEIAFFPPVTGG